MRTNALVLRHPKGVWQEIRVESPRSVALMLVNFGLASALATAGIAVGGAQFKGASAVYALVFFVVAFDLLLLLTLIESVGVRTFGGRRKWRITRRVADAVCGHASAGWILSGVGVAAGWHLAQRVDIDTVGAWVAGVAGPRYTPGSDVMGPAILIGIVGAGLMIGLLAFEFLVFFGVRRMRFANAPGAGANTLIASPAAVDGTSGAVER